MVIKLLKCYNRFLINFKYYKTDKSNCNHGGELKMTKIGYKPLIALALAVFVSMSIACAAAGGEKGTNTNYINSLPYAINDSGKYLLNISQSGIIGTAITINADDVILDGNGNYLEGDDIYWGWMGDSGVYVYDCSKVTIKDMQISKFGSGIWINNATECKILKNNASDNMDGIMAWYSDNNNIEDNFVCNNTWGISVDLSTGNKVVNNIVNYNYQAGLDIQGSNCNRFITNEVSYNTNFGIWGIMGSTNNSIIANTALNNSLYDISLDSENILKGNKYVSME